MKVLITADDGTVVNEYDLDEYIANAAEEFPNADASTRKEMALDDLHTDVWRYLRLK